MMAAPMDLSSSELPEELPLLPLRGALLLPGSRLVMPLPTAAEQRLAARCLADGELLGLVQVRDDKDGSAEGDALYSVGCAGRIDDLQDTGGGPAMTVTGWIRFRLVRELPREEGQRRARVTCLEFEEDLWASAAPLEPDALAAEVRERLGPGADGAVSEPALAGLLAGGEMVDALAQVYPFSTAERQALLEAPDPEARQQVLLRLLRLAPPGAPPGGAPS